MLVESKDHFSDECISVLNGISALCLGSENCLLKEHMREFSCLFKADLSSLSNEIQVLQPMLKGRQLQNMVGLYVELLPLKEAFPTVMSLLYIALTIPISSTTCERDFDIDYEKMIDILAQKHRNSRILLK